MYYSLHRISLILDMDTTTLLPIRNFVNMVVSSTPQLTNLTFGLASLNITDLLSFTQPFDVSHIRAIFIVMYVLVFLCCVIGM